VLAASQPNQISLELGPPIEHGVFSYYLIEALNGSADTNRDGAVDLLETVGYLSARVPEKVRQAGGKQEPLFDGRGITNPHLFVLAQNPIGK
jgi:uncharacterized caspase-like protein